MSSFVEDAVVAPPPVGLGFGFATTGIADATGADPAEEGADVVGASMALATALVIVGAVELAADGAEAIVRSGVTGFLSIATTMPSVAPIPVRVASPAMTKTSDERFFGRAEIGAAVGIGEADGECVTAGAGAASTIVGARRLVSGCDGEGARGESGVRSATPICVFIPTLIA